MRTCTITMDDGTTCERPLLCKGMCTAHYNRARYGMNMGASVRITPRGVNAGECHVDGCERAAFTRGLCGAHYQRRHIRLPKGRLVDLDAPVREKGLSDEVKVERILAVASPDGDCLIAARIGSDGYATSVKDEQGRQIKSHRLIYRVKVGPLPKGEQVHHACANRACINPEHLVAATQRENVGEMHARRAYEQRIAALEAEVARLQAQLAELGVTA